MASYLQPRGPAELVDPSSVPSLVSNQTIEQYIRVAAVATLIYDALITMDKEAKYFWKFPSTMVNIVYFLNRYIGILGAMNMLLWYSYNMSLIQCSVFYWTYQLSTWIVIVLIDYILVIRVLALYAGDKTFSLYLKTLLALEACVTLSVIIKNGVLQDLTIGIFAKELTACGKARPSPFRLILVRWTIPLAYGSLLMLLAIYKAAEHWKDSAGFKGFTLLNVLIQDQILYFFIVVSCCIFNILSVRVATDSAFLSALFMALGDPSFLSVLGNRMLFNLKEAGELGVNGGANYRNSLAFFGTVTNIEFAAPNVLSA